MTDGRADPGQQLIGAEGLCQIVVRPQVQGSDFVLFMGPGGDHHYGQAGPAANLAQDIQTVHVWETEVQDHQVGTVGGNHGQGLTAGTGLHRLVAVVVQHGGDEVGDALFIFDDQNFFTNIHQKSS